MRLLQKKVDAELAAMGQRLKYFRETELQMDIRQFVEDLDIDHSLWSKIERGERNLTNPQLIKLHLVYHLNTNWIITGMGEMFAANTPPSISVAVKGFIVNWIKDNKVLKAKDLNEAKDLLKTIENWEKKLVK